jgi:hypothetical protein
MGLHVTPSRSPSCRIPRAVPECRSTQGEPQSSSSPVTGAVRSCLCQAFLSLHVQGLDGSAGQICRRETPSATQRLEPTLSAEPGTGSRLARGPGSTLHSHPFSALVTLILLIIPSSSNEFHLPQGRLFVSCIWRACNVGKQALH